MKKYYFTIVLLMTVYYSFSQIQKEMSYQGSASIAQLETEGYKYYVVDGVNNKCLLYNTDHSLWKDVAISVPENNFIAEIMFVSQHVFNNDDNIEMLVIFAKYDTSGGIPHYVYTTEVFGEAGNSLVTVEGGGYATIGKVAGDDAKLIVYIYDMLVSTYPVGTDVYDIPGMPLNASGENVDLPGKVANPYPNPAGDFVNLPYMLNAGDDYGYLKIYDEAGNEVRSFKVGRDFDNIKVLTSGLRKGVYFYSLQAKHTPQVTKKFVIR